MSEIRNKTAYPLKNYPIVTDYFIGSDSEKDGRTVNFPIQAIINMASGLMDYMYSLSSLPIESPEGDGFFQTNGITDFSLVTTISVSRKTLAGQDLTNLLNFLKLNNTEFTLKIISKTNQNIFAYYSIDLVTEHTNYYDLKVVLAPGNNYLGALVNKDIYTFGYDKIPGTGPDLITQTITDGDTTHAPSGNAVFDALALKADITQLHNPVTIGTANGLSIVPITQILSLGLASTSTTGALSSTDWNTFNNKQDIITNPVTGIGTTNRITKFLTPSSIGDSSITDTGSLVTIANSLTLGTLPTTSAGTYDILTRDTTTGLVEKISSSAVVAGTGLVGQVSFWTGANTQAGDPSFIWDSVTKKLAITKSSAGIQELLALRNFNNSIGVLDGVRLNLREFNIESSSTYGSSDGILTIGLNTNKQISLLQNGNVGIGTINPTYLLDVNGTTRLSSTVTLGTQPTTSAGTYDILTRNISTGVVEKVLSTTFQPALVNPITGIGTLNTIPKFTPNGTTLGNSSITDSGSLVTIANPTVISGTVNAASGIARGAYINTTSVATANGDVLVGLDINPTFTNGAFTGLQNIGLRVNTRTSIFGTISNGGLIQFARGSDGIVNSSVGYSTPINSSDFIFSNLGGSATFGFILNGNRTLQGNVSGNWIVQTGGTFTDNGYRLEVVGTSKIGSTLTLGTLPTTSVGTYDILTRNTSTGVVEKVLSTAFQPPLGFTPENVANKQNAMTIDGTGVKYPTVDAVNFETNYIARAVVATGFLDTTDPFTISRFDDFTLAISATQFGIAFSQRFKTLPYAPSDGIINIVSQNIPLSAIGLVADGTYIRFVGIQQNGTFVWSTTQFIQSPSVCQLGIVLVKRVAGVTSFIDINRTAITIPDVSAYSNLDTTATGVKATTSIAAIAATLSHTNTLGKLVGISVAWGTSNNDSKVIPLNNPGPTPFTRLHPGNALTVAPPATFTVMDPTQYWNGAALIAIPGGAGVSSVQRLLFTVNGNFVWQYGEATYTNLISAQNNILQAVFTNILPEGTYAEIGRMAITKACTDLNSSNAQYYPTGSSGGGSGTSPVAPTAWGFITGNIDDQLDLKAKLDARPTGSGANGQITFWNGVTTQIGNANLIWDNTNKRLAIGTASPITNLHTNIAAQIIGSATPTGGLLISDTTNTSFSLELGANVASGPWIQARSYSAATTYNLLLNPSGGKIIIGSQSDSGAKLQVNGTASGSNAVNTNEFVTLSQLNTATTGIITGTGSAGRAAFWTGASAISNDNEFRWDNTNKRLGIGGPALFGKLELQITGFGTQTFSMLASDGTQNPRAFIQHITASGSQRVNFTGSFSTSTTFPNWTFEFGNVGIGTTNPTESKLVVQTQNAGVLTDNLLIKSNSITTDTEVGIFFSPSDAGIIRGSRISSRNNGSNSIDLRFWTGNGASITEKMMITPLGNVGIGTSTPQGKFEINTGTINPYAPATQAAGTISFTNGSSGATQVISGKTLGAGNGIGLYFSSLVNDSNTAADMQLDVRAVDNTSFTTLTTSAFTFSTNNAILVNVLRNGNVGIGSSPPTQKLDVDGVAVSKRFHVNNTGNGSVVAPLYVPGITGNNIDLSVNATGVFFGNEYSGNFGTLIQFRVNGRTASPEAVTAMTINPLGNVGIGTVTPTLGRLHVYVPIGTRIIHAESNLTPTAGVTMAQGISLTTLTMEGANTGYALTAYNVNATSSLGISSQVALAADTGTVPLNLIQGGRVDNTGAGLGAVGTRPILGVSNFATRLMTILANGDTGFGTPTPLAKLDVKGDVNISTALAGSVASPLKRKFRVSNYLNVESGYMSINDLSSDTNATDFVIGLRDGPGALSDRFTIKGVDSSIISIGSRFINSQIVISNNTDFYSTSVVTSTKSRIGGDGSVMRVGPYNFQSQFSIELDGITGPANSFVFYGDGNATRPAGGAVFKYGLDVLGNVLIGNGATAELKYSSALSATYSNLIIRSNAANSGTQIQLLPNGTSTGFPGIILNDSSTAAVGSNTMLLGRGNSTLPITNFTYIANIITGNLNANSFHLGFLVSNTTDGRIQPFSILNTGKVLVAGVNDNASGAVLQVTGTTSGSAGTAASHYVTKAQLDAVALRPYKVYTALLSQSGSADPTFTVLENSIGTLVWTRAFAGDYRGTLTGAFTANKVWITIGGGYTPVGGVFIKTMDLTNFIRVITSNAAGVFIDDVLNATSIEIRVYP